MDGMNRSGMNRDGMNRSEMNRRDFAGLMAGLLAVAGTIAGNGRSAGCRDGGRGYSRQGGECCGGGAAGRRRCSAAKVGLF